VKRRERALSTPLRICTVLLRLGAWELEPRSSPVSCRDYSFVLTPSTTPYLSPFFFPLSPTLQSSSRQPYTTHSTATSPPPRCQITVHPQRQIQSSKYRRRLLNLRNSLIHSGLEVRSLRLRLPQGLFTVQLLILYDQGSLRLSQLRSLSAYYVIFVIVIQLGLASFS
jgi:hypothetical protein